MKIAIVTDSTADLRQEDIDRYDIGIIPLDVIFGEQTFQDGVDLSAQAFYEKMAESTDLPKTSQPPTARFINVYEAYLQRYDAIVGIFLSGRLSGTLQGAQAAASMVKGNITILDSKTTTAALGLQVLAAAKMAQAGATLDEIVARVQTMRTATQAYIVLDNLDNLYRGGRVGGAAKLVSSLLQIKPVIYLEDGVVEVFAKVRTYKRAVDSLLVHFAEQVKDKQKIQAVAIYTAGANVEDFLWRMKEIAPRADISVTMIGPVVGVHVGAGGVGLVYFAE